MISKAETLRTLAGQAYSNNPDSWQFEQRALTMPMTFDLAYALVSYAATNTKLAITDTDSHIKRIQLAGNLRKRRPCLSTIADTQRALRDLECEADRLKQQSLSHASKICDIVCSSTPNRQPPLNLPLHQARQPALVRGAQIAERQLLRAQNNLRIGGCARGVCIIIRGQG